MPKAELTPPVRALSALALMLFFAPAAHAASVELPEGYKHVEYIQSTGAQFIDTGIAPKSTTRVVLDFAFTENPTTAALCGWGSSGGREAFLFGAGPKGFYTTISKDWKDTAYVKDATGEANLPLDTERHVFDVAKGSQKFDGAEYGTVATLGDTATAAQTLYLFASRTGWSPFIDYKMKAKIYSCQIYEGDVLKRNFVPCVRMSDSKPGLYDLTVSDGTGFYGNRATGADFTAGPEVGSKLIVSGSPLQLGTATPAYGRAVYPEESTDVDFSLADGEEVADDEGVWFFSAAGDVRAQYLNATFTGADGNPETIDVASFTRTITGDSSVQWNFGEPKYRLVAEAGTGGTVTVDGVTGTAITNWYPAGTSVQVSVSELPAGKVFGGWGGLEGDLPATITLTMDAPYDIYPLTPTVAIDRVQQRYPWNGLVDIDYTVSDVKGDPADYQLELSVTFADETRRMWSFTDFAPCDAPLSDGSHRITWNAPADGVERLARDASVSARLVYAPTTERDADYLIIDLSGGLDADAYPIKCVKGGDPRQFNSDRYKTDRLVLKRVSSGSFWMGEGTKVSGDYIGDVGPETASRHYVTLTRDYFLGLFPVTQRQHELVTGAKHYDVTPPGDCERPTKPVFDISWDAIMGLDTGKASFLANLSARTSYHGIPVKGFSLPTEAQFEYALRAGTTNSYCYGSNATNDLPRFAYYSANKSARSEWGVAGYGHVGPLPPVGTFLPNAWGFYDMQSLVHEWCSDWYGEYPAGDEANPVVDPTGPATGTQKVLRGGSAYYGAAYVNSGARFKDTQTYDRISAMHAVYGFRIMKYVP